MPRESQRPLRKLRWKESRARQMGYDPNAFERWLKGEDPRGITLDELNRCIPRSVEPAVAGGK